MRIPRLNTLFQSVNHAFNSRISSQCFQQLDRIRQVSSEFLRKGMCQFSRLPSWKRLGIATIAVWTTSHKVSVASSEELSAYYKRRYDSAILRLLQAPNFVKFSEEVGGFDCAIVPPQLAPLGSTCLFKDRRIYLSTSSSDWGPEILLQLARLKLVSEVLQAQQNKCIDREEFIDRMLKIEYRAFKAAHDVASIAIQNGYWDAHWDVYSLQFSPNAPPPQDWKTFASFRISQTNTLGALYGKDWDDSCMGRKQN